MMSLLAHATSASERLCVGIASSQSVSAGASMSKCQLDKEWCDWCSVESICCIESLCDVCKGEGNE
jgi:hypothetical protein